MAKKTISDDKKVVVKSLIDAGSTYRKIAEIMDVSLGTIAKIAKEFVGGGKLVEYYRENRVDILLKAQIGNLDLQQLIRASMTADKIKGMTAGEKARWYQVLGTDFGIKFDKERLERGESTENIAHIHKVAKAIRDRRRGLIKENNGADQG